MIARDEELNLPLCLNSVRGIVDETIVVDTGSADRTPDIAESLGARVVPFAWRDDFAAAKNFALEQATSDWVLFLDADEMIVPDTMKNIRPLIELPHRGPRCYRLIRRDLVDHGGQRIVCHVPVDRLFVRHPDLRYVRPIHEQLQYFGRLEDYELVQTERVQINHFGYTTLGRCSASKRHRRDTEILERLIETHPDDGINYYYLSREALDQGNSDRAIELLEASIARARSRGDEQWLVDAYSRLIVAYYSAGRQHDAVRAGEAAVSRFDEGALWCNLGVAQAAIGADDQAIVSLERAFSLRNRKPMIPTEVGATTWRPLTNLALVHERRGALTEAYEALIQAQQFLPEDRSLTDRTDHILRTLTYRPADQLPAGPPAAGRVVFFVGPSIEPWDPRSLERGGIGGSETAVIQMALELSRIGYDVTVFNEPIEEGIYEGVAYRNWRRFNPQQRCDLFVSVRLAAVFDTPIDAGIKWLWMHDTHVGPTLTPKRLQEIDAVLVLTNWHRQFVRDYYRIPSTKLIVTRNGLDLTRFRGIEPRQRHRFIYSSAPNRGLDRILELWPRIRRFWPDAEIHVFYGWRTYDAFIEQQPDQAEQLIRLKQKIWGLMNQDGVIYHDRIDQHELARQFMRSDIWFYPTDWSETFCITALEAQAGGAIPVTNNLAALGEVVKGGIVLPYQSDRSDDDAYLEALQRLDEEQLCLELRQRGLSWVAGFSWTAVAREWHLRFQALRKAASS